MKKNALLEDRLCSSPHVGLQKSNLEREKCPRRSKPESESESESKWTTHSRQGL